MKHNIDDFSVDRFHLEIEAERNGVMMRHYTKQLAIASGNTKDLKRKLDAAQANQAELIRINHAAYGLKKNPTDKVVFALALDEPEYKVQWKLYLKAFKHEKDLESAVLTCKQRGMMIGILAKLWLNNYYSVPTSGRDLGKQYEKLLSDDVFNDENFDMDEPETIDYHIDDDDIQY